MRAAAAFARPAVARRAWTVDRLLQGSVFTGTVLLVAVPVVPILYQSVLDRPLYDPARTFTLANYGRLFLSGEFGRVALNTLLFAGMSTALALLLGTAFAVLLARTDLPGSGWLAGVFTAPLYLSRTCTASVPSPFRTLRSRTPPGSPGPGPCGPSGGSPCRCSVLPSSTLEVLSIPLVLGTPVGSSCSRRTCTSSAWWVSLRTTE